MRARVEDLLLSNNKIQAVKMVMHEYQISLKQAKELVDSVAPTVVLHSQKPGPDLYSCCSQPSARSLLY